MSDPRVYFAAERTLLAWIRTGLAIMGFGFIIARWGFFDVAQEPKSWASIASSIAGIFFVLIGSAGILVARKQFDDFIRTLPEADFPANYSMTLSRFTGWALSLLGCVLASCLLHDVVF